MNRSHALRIFVLASIGLFVTLSLAGCSDDKTTSAQFTASRTAPAPGLVKLEESSRSGSRVAVDVRLYGPGPDLDLFGFRFGIRIGNTSLVNLVPQTTYTQTALVADDGQTIAIDVNGVEDPGFVQVNIETQGGGAGDGFEAASVVVIRLVFDVHGSGSTTLTLTGLGLNPPLAIASTRAPIAPVTFDAASASVSGVTTGGGY